MKLIDKAAYDEKQLTERWNWLVDDISDHDTRLNTMIVLENSYKKMVSDGIISEHWLEDVILREDEDETLEDSSKDTRILRILKKNLLM